MHNPLPKEAKEMIWGSMFGDGGVYFGTENRHAGFRVSHSPKQFSYLKWKYDLLKPVVASKIYSVTAYHKVRQKEYTTMQFSTKALSYFTRLRKIFYPYGKKLVRRKLLNKLTPLGLATWFMDDGTGIKNQKNYPQIYLATTGFSFEENRIIQDYFKENHGIETRIHRDSKYFKMYFNRPNSLKLIQIIKPHLIPSMMYKIRHFLQTSPIRQVSVEDIV